MNKEYYIQRAQSLLTGEAQLIAIKQIELFFKENKNIIINKYDVGEYVKLSKGTYIHGIPGLKDNFDWIINNGFIGNDFTQDDVHNKIKNSIGMWIIKNDCLLKDYIEQYSGFTITYTIGRGPGSKEITDLIPFHKFDEYTERINNDKNIWMYWGDQTKEVRFIPSLVANKRQIAFILNMDSEYAQEISKYDVWEDIIDDKIVEQFVDYRYYEKFLVERKNRNAQITDRETAIVFGLPPHLIEGVFVGREAENDTELLSHIKEQLPNCYICNLDGKVIVANK